MAAHGQEEWTRIPAHSHRHARMQQNIRVAGNLVFLSFFYDKVSYFRFCFSRTLDYRLYDFIGIIWRVRATVIDID